MTADTHRLDALAGTYDYSALGYPGIELWSDAAWRDRRSPVSPLARWIQTENHERRRFASRGAAGSARDDGQYDHKTRTVSYPEVVERWSDAGLHWVCDEMGGTNWIIMLPNAIAEKGGVASRMLLSLHDVDADDQNWAMDLTASCERYFQEAAKDGTVVLLVATDGYDTRDLYSSIAHEVQTRFHFRAEQTLLDLSPLRQSGAALADVDGFALRDEHGAEIADSDALIGDLWGVPVLDVTGRLHSRVSQFFTNATADANHNSLFDFDRMVHSTAGRRMAEAMEIEHRYDDASDPELLARWERLGVRYETHMTNGEQWLTMTPARAAAQPDRLLPVMLVFIETSALNPFEPLMAVAGYYEYLDLVADGELILLYFVMESADDNDLLVDILEEATAAYPIDRSRVYLTGQSHNGHFLMEFARRHPRLIAAAATLGNAHGIPAPPYSHQRIKVTDEMVDAMASMDLPVINVAGRAETDFATAELGTTAFDNAVDAWQRRLRSIGREPVPYAAVEGARTSEDYATRRMTVPGDRTEVQYLMGSECYISDVRNGEGHWRLRLVSVDNLPHMIFPQMVPLSWDFVRRFARDQTTGETIELS